MGPTTAAADGNWVFPEPNPSTWSYNTFLDLIFFFFEWAAFVKLVFGQLLFLIVHLQYISDEKIYRNIIYAIFIQHI